MKTNIATDSSQSDRLLRCGVSADTADMCWIAPNRLVTGGVGFPTLMCAEYFKHDDSIHQNPAWSLGALLGLLPFKIHSCKHEYWLDIAPMDYGKQWSIGYYCMEKPKVIKGLTRAYNPIECAVQEIEWLTINGYKLNEI